MIGIPRFGPDSGDFAGIPGEVRKALRTSRRSRCASGAQLIRLCALGGKESAVGRLPRLGMLFDNERERSGANAH